MKPTRLKVRLYGDPSLTQVCEPIDSVGPGERMLIRAMIETMKQEKGIGLAAPQVGINKRLFVVDIGDGHGPEALINPKIVKKFGRSVMEEGCLSIPEININVTRANAIIVEYMTADNELMEAECEGLLARVIQHENDHLDGKLITEYASPQELEKIQSKLAGFEKKSRKS